MTSYDAGAEANRGTCIYRSFCTFAKIREVTAQLAKKDRRIVPIYSDNVQSMDTRFGTAEEFQRDIEKITGEKGIRTIPEAEPIGPTGYLDALIIAPCTGNTMAKLCAGITDTPVLMAAKAHLRNEKPLILSISTNDALGMNFKNIGMLMNMKHIYFVPFGQDNYKKKTNSMIAHTDTDRRNTGSRPAGKAAPACHIRPAVSGSGACER